MEIFITLRESNPRPWNQGSWHKPICNINSYSVSETYINHWKVKKIRSTFMNFYILSSSREKTKPITQYSHDKWPEIYKNSTKVKIDWFILLNVLNTYFWHNNRYMGLSHELFSGKKQYQNRNEEKKQNFWYFVCPSLSYNNGLTPLPIVMEFVTIVLCTKATYNVRNLMSVPFQNSGCFVSLFWIYGQTSERILTNSYI